jgi:hypothetical protein
MKTTLIKTIAFLLVVLLTNLTTVFGQELVATNCIEYRKVNNNWVKVDEKEIIMAFQIDIPNGIIIVHPIGGTPDVYNIKSSEVVYGQGNVEIPRLVTNFGVYTIVKNKKGLIDIVFTKPSMKLVLNTTSRYF